MSRIVIIGGGPAGYEAALVAAQLGADVTLIERDGAGGACVISDCVPSKTFIATSGAMNALREVDMLGVRASDKEDITVDAPAVHERVRRLARAQSGDIHRRLVGEGVRVITGTARFAADQSGRRAFAVTVTAASSGSGPEPYQGASTASLRAGTELERPASASAVRPAVTETIAADVVLLATGATPRIMPGAEPDGERILSWREVYDLKQLPEHLIVVGSGVTGAEFASAYLEMGVEVTLISSRDRVLPGEDADAATVVEEVFTKRGMHVLSRSRAAGVRRTEGGVVVRLTDGREVTGSHALMTVGSVPNVEDLGLQHAGVELDERGFIAVDRVSRTNVGGVYAAGDCTGVLMLASVAAMQGRIAVWHALGEAVEPLKLKTVAANVFTHPEIASVGLTQDVVRGETVRGRTITLPLATNPRAKMAGLAEGFVKLFCRPATGGIVGGVVVAPSASELILPITLAVQNNLTVYQLAHTFTVYPSLTGSIAEAARQLMLHDDLD